MSNQQRNTSRKAAATALITAVIASTAAVSSAQEDDGKLTPLPSETFTVPPADNPVRDMTKAIADNAEPDISSRIPETLQITNEGGDITYDTQAQTIIYQGKDSPVRMRTEDQDVLAQTIIVDLANQTATVQGPVTVYHDETLTLAESGTYNWKTGELHVKEIRSKMGGVLVRGSSLEYKKDAKGKQYMAIHDAFLTTDDVEKPGSWVGAGELKIYPGDYARLTRLSLSSGGKGMAVPVLGWIPLSHSLNPKEGYLPYPGVKSSWGAYLLNQYGWLIGNKRVEKGMPTADYILTGHADFRARRGLGVGVDLEDVKLQEEYSDMTGFSLYYLTDDDPMVNQTNSERLPTDRERYRASAKWMREYDAFQADPNAKWSIATDINILSDRYVLRDFFEESSSVNDKPDNSVRLERRMPYSTTIFLNRFAPNDFYATDIRSEVTHYRVRKALGRTGIAYESRSSFGYLAQEVPAHERAQYMEMLENLRDSDTRDYYMRLLNSNGYLRLNTTHEFTTSFKPLNFLNVTPKAGFGYTGYYGVDGVGTDHRFLGYLGCDFDAKFHRHYSDFKISRLGYEGLTHIFQPYTSLSHTSLSSSNDLVPQVDTWSSVFGNGTTNPMPMDLMATTGIDGWGAWSVWRFGARNIFYTKIDGERRNLFKWDAFIDYNAETPYDSNTLSNLYSALTFSPTSRLKFKLETITPAFGKGDDYKQTNTYISYMPTPWLETQIGHRRLKDHPIQEDVEQVYLRTNIRFNEKYIFNARWYWDLEDKRMPIQQYTLFRKSGAWYVGATIFRRDNGGRKELGVGLSFTLSETATTLPVKLF